MIIPIVTITESKDALITQGFTNEEPLTTVNVFDRKHDAEGRKYIIAHDGEILYFDDDCGIEEVMHREAEIFAKHCEDSGLYSKVVIGFIDTQAGQV